MSEIQRSSEDTEESNNKDNMSKSTDSGGVSNIKNLEHLVDSFINIYETPISELKTLNNVQIKNSFQIAIAIEKSIECYGGDNDFAMWANSFEIMLDDKKKLPPKYDTMFFLSSCDKWLEKFFMLNEPYIDQTDIAVRIYTSILPPERLKTFFLDLLTTSASYQAIQEFIFENEDIDIKILQFKLVLQDWIPEYEEGRHGELTKVIQRLMSPYNSKKSLHVLIGIIAIETDSENESHVRELVHKEVLQKMCSRSKLSRDFWLSLLAVDPTITIRACELSEHFHVSLCKFLIFIGSMMDRVEEGDDTKWVPMSTSIYPELTYEFLREELKCLASEVCGRRDVIMRMLHKAEEETECVLWKQLLEII